MVVKVSSSQKHGAVNNKAIPKINNEPIKINFLDIIYLLSLLAEASRGGQESKSAFGELRIKT